MECEILSANPVHDVPRLDRQPSPSGPARLLSVSVADRCLYPGLPDEDLLPRKTISSVSRVRARWRPRVLYLDDRNGIRDSVTQLLHAAGCPCETVPSAEAAFRRCISHRAAIDVVLTEHAPPRFNGLELIKNLREAGFEGKIFLHSTRLTEEEQASFAQLAVDWLVIKPGGLAEILQGLEEWQAVSALF
jgi:CheY-like chemotaxis protein